MSPRQNGPSPAPTGFLRDGASLRWSDVALTLSYGLWSTSLPRSWVDRTPGFAEFLARGLSAERLLERSEDAQHARELWSVLVLLRAQGGLSAPPLGAECALRDVRELFMPLCLDAYGRYYSHPLWGMLRTGRLPRSGFATWLLHNYHLSRSAGATAARAAVSAQRAGVRATFLESALEEYSHCADHYSVRHPELDLPDCVAHELVPLPSDTAFDQQMFRLAEDDWLAHVLVALFQEQTAHFAGECSRFYREVEASYGLPGFFRRWEAHIAIDGDRDHAGSFDALLESDEKLPAAFVLASLQSAWHTMEFLVGSLGEIVALAQRSPEPLYRRPIRDGRFDPLETALVPRAAPCSRLRARSPAELQRALRARVLDPPAEVEPAPPEDLRFLRADVAESVLRALGYTRSHGEVLLLGGLAELFHPGGAAEPTAPRSPYCLAVANFLRESARRPDAFALLLHHLDARASEAPEGALLPGGRAARRRLAAYLDQPLADGEADRLATLLLQLDELLALWLRSRASAPLIDLLRR